MAGTTREEPLKKVLAAGLVLGALTMVGTASASDPIYVPIVSDVTKGEGCVSQGANDTCTYTATRSGGYVAAGSTWSLTIDDDADGFVDRSFGPANAPEQGCGLWGPGAVVTISSGAQSEIAAGNPFPVQSDPVISDNNNC
jgi:hypothetical protein